MPILDGFQLYVELDQLKIYRRRDETTGCWEFKASCLPGYWGEGEGGVEGGEWWGLRVEGVEGEEEIKVNFMNFNEFQ